MPAIAVPFLRRVCGPLRKLRPPPKRDLRDRFNRGLGSNLRRNCVRRGDQLGPHTARQGPVFPALRRESGIAVQCLEAWPPALENAGYLPVLRPSAVLPLLTSPWPQDPVQYTQYNSELNRFHCRDKAPHPKERASRHRRNRQASVKIEHKGDVMASRGYLLPWSRRAPVTRVNFRRGK